MSTYRSRTRDFYVIDQAVDLEGVLAAAGHTWRVHVSFPATKDIDLASVVLGGYVAPGIQIDVTEAALGYGAYCSGCDLELEPGDPDAAEKLQYSVCAEAATELLDHDLESQFLCPSERKALVSARNVARVGLPVDAPLPAVEKVREVSAV